MSRLLIGLILGLAGLPPESILATGLGTTSSTLSAQLTTGSLAGNGDESSPTVKSEPTTAALEAARIVSRSQQALRDLGPHELTILVTPISGGVADSSSTRTMWVLREGVFLGRVDGRTGLQLYIRDEKRWTVNPTNGRYYRWSVFPPEPPISPEGQGKYLIDEAELIGTVDFPQAGPLWHLRAKLEPQLWLDAYYSKSTGLLVRTEMVGTATTIREDMSYQRRPNLNDSDLVPPLPANGKEVMHTEELR